MQQIQKNSLDAVMQVLMIMVYADRRAKFEELEYLRACIPRLSLFGDNTFEKPTKGMDLLIREHMEHIHLMMDDTELFAAIDLAIRRIDDTDLQPRVLHAMKEVATADADLHISESTLISRATAQWHILNTSAKPTVEIDKT